MAPNQILLKTCDDSQPERLRRSDVFGGVAEVSVSFTGEIRKESRPDAVSGRVLSHSGACVDRSLNAVVGRVVGCQFGWWPCHGIEEWSAAWVVV